MIKIINLIIKIIRNEYIMLAIILISGFILRLYKIDNPIADWHSWRQADTESVSRRYVEEGINLLYPKYYDISSIQTGIYNPNGYRFVEFPIFNIFQIALFKTIPKIPLEIWGRMVSILSVLSSSVLIYLIGKKVMGTKVGVLSAFFFLFIPFNVYFSRVILPEPLTVMFALLFIYFYLIFIETDKSTYLYFSGVFFAIALLLKPYIIFYALPLVYLTLKKYKIHDILSNFRVLIRFLIFVDIIFIPLILWRGWMANYPEGIPFWKWAFNGDGIRFRPAFWRWIFAERLGNLILGIWGLIPFAFGVLTTKKGWFNHMFLLGMFLYVSVVATASVRHDYYQIFTIPVISLVLASGSVSIWNNKSYNKILSRMLLIFAVVMMFGVGLYQVKEYYKINHPEIIAAGAAIQKISDKNSKVIAPYNGDTAFLYQTDRLGWPAVDDSFDNLIKKGADYYVSVSFNDADTIFITSHYKTVEKTGSYLIADLHQKIL